ncbi:adenosine deaminase [Streptomyces sp. NPDC004134]|uniref:adenosine deaminase family protein n=1 Tax=Streptomyces sp. NPDC004134 TaxID=3364691 RepID=UPI0036C37626
MRDAGLRVTAHAGEAAGPDSVRAALDALHPDRIGHGVRAAEDPRLMERLADAGVTLEVALTSNVQTRAAASLREHPVRRLIGAGVAVSLNTDNPTPSATGVAAEYRRAATEVGLSAAELRRIARDSAAAAFTEAGRQTAAATGG